MISIHSQHRFPSQDVEIAVRRFGSATGGKTPVLFVHGLSYFSYDWVDIGARICLDREGVAMDMRGFGDSSASPTQDYSVKTMAADIGNLLDGLGWEKAIIVAHSMGGRSATCFAADHPDRVSALVLVDWSPENAPEGSKRVATTVAETPDAFPTLDAAIAYFRADASDAEVRERFGAYLRPVPGGLAVKRDDFFRQQFRRQLATGAKPTHGVDLWAMLAQLEVPTLVLRGTRSDLFAAATLPKVKQANARIQVQEIDAGHNIAGDNPAAATSAVRSFIDLQEQALRSAPPMRGIDHLAFVTDDLPATMDFYTRVLKMRLVHVRRVPFERDRGQPPYDKLRHYFFDMGHDQLLAFFEYPKGLSRQNRDLPGGMQHVAFHVEPSRFDELVEHVRRQGVDVIGPVALGGRFWSAYFYDPNGIRLELATSRLPTRIGIVDSVLQMEHEARAELETLFADATVVQSWLDRMPLKGSESI